MLITIENRGTSEISSATLDYQINGIPHQTLLQNLQPGGLRVVEIPVSRSQLDAPEGVTVVARLPLEGDSIPADNDRKTTIRIRQ